MKILTTLIAIGSTICLQSQTVYIEDSFTLNTCTHVGHLDLSTRKMAAVSQQSWDMGFSNNRHEYTLKINDVGGVKLFKTFMPRDSFNQVTLKDTIRRMHNSSSFMLQGAFDQNPYTKVNSQDDYQVGWGIEIMGSHNGIGDTVFIIKTKSSTWKKLYIDYFPLTVSAPRKYVMKISNIDGTNTKDLTIFKNFDTLDKYYSHYDLDAERYDYTETEPILTSYDLYYKSFQLGPYKVPMGIFQNNSFSLLGPVKAGGIQPYQDWHYSFVPAYNVPATPVASAVYNKSLYDNAFALTSNDNIGMTWFDPIQRVVKPDNSYFIRDRKGTIWHYYITGFTPIDPCTYRIAYKLKDVGTFLNIENSTKNNLIIQNHYSVNEKLNINGLENYIIDIYSLDEKKVVSFDSKSNVGKDIVMKESGMFFLKIVDLQSNTINITKIVVE
jgi:hypothetical protein